VLKPETIKKKAMRKGADLCGIAPVSRFKDAPAGFHPCDIYPDCKSVFVFASRFPLSTLHARTNSPYTMVRNIMAEKVDLISFHLSDELEKEGILSVPIPSSDPYDYWDSDQNHGRGILSLKHAGALAGIGVIGKNTLLINEEYGNMIWLGALLINSDLDPDPLANYEVCNERCTVCLDSCPQNALNGTTIDQKLCRQLSNSRTTGGGGVISCNICRKVCPNHNGI
jgi:epoxyqueuosine reductase QueG